MVGSRATRVFAAQTCQEVESRAGRPLEPEPFKDGVILKTYTAALSDEL